MSRRWFIILSKNSGSQGVIFEDCDIAINKHPELFKKYFMKCVPNNDHKFAALHGAVWSGGTFVYPEGSQNGSAFAGLFSDECSEPGAV